MPWLNTNEITKDDEATVKKFEKTVFGIDFDGTIVENDFPYVGKPNPGAIEVLQELSKVGVKLILITMRSDDKLHEAVVYCNKNNVNFWGINENPEQEKWSNSPKIYATVYVDDANAGIPLKMGSNEKPCVDWAKLRDLFVQWEVLPPLEAGDGSKTFQIK
uniref:HAD-like superfamily protein n=1 Tax=Burkholderia phage vB_BgluM-SURPRISE13 TaxID=3159457 RepID=A0AAU7PFF4_9VIRU